MKKIKKQYKPTGKLSLLAVDETTKILSSLGNILDRLKKSVDFEIFRPLLEDNLRPTYTKKTGAKSYDYLLMFKILILQFCYGLSDD